MPHSMKVTIDTPNAVKTGLEDLRHKPQDKKPEPPKDKVNADR